MTALSEAQALALLRSGAPISYDDLDDIFAAFDVHGSFEAPDTTYYSHPRYVNCGEFKAKPLHDFSVLSDGQIDIVRRVISCIRQRSRLEEE